MPFARTPSPRNLLTRGHLAALALLALVATPLLWSLWGAVLAGFNAAAWAALRNDTQVPRAFVLSLWTGVASSALAVAMAAWVLSRTVGQPSWGRLVRWLGPMLAVPHAAFAIGLVFLVAPSGWVLRALSPWATGFAAPPAWVTTQDPWGVGLIAVLALKEVPFLLWTAMAHLQRPDVALRLERELQLAHTLGYGPGAAWWRVGWPQLWPRLAAPMLAVLAYSLSVVDVALVIGPTAPPTLAVLTWQWLIDANPATNAQGAAAAWLLGAALCLCACVAWLATQLPLWRARRVRGAPHTTGLRTSALHAAARAGSTLWLLAGVYGAVLLALLLGSVFGHWPFPALLPRSWTVDAWQSVWGSRYTLVTTMWLGLGSALAALLWVVAWLELAPPRWNTPLRALLLVPLVLPAVLWVVGLHRLALDWGLDAQGPGVWLAHTLAALPYVWMALAGAYSGFDARLHHIAASLGHGRWVFLVRIKWPLLKAALGASFAVGFAVSVAQYLPTLYVGAGRFATVTTEAVTLAAGAQRSLTAAYAWLQWLLPVSVFGVAAWLARPRRFPKSAAQCSPQPQRP